MLAAQNGRCAVCGKADPEHVDHDPRTGRVRGLLCFTCNQALGNVRDDLWVLSRLGEYLRHAGDKLPDLLYVERRLRTSIVECTWDGRHVAGAP